MQPSLSSVELEQVRSFASSDESIVPLLKRGFVQKLSELQIVTEIDDTLPLVDIGAQTLARIAAHDKLVEIFESLGFGALKEILNKRESKKSFR